MEKKEEYKTRKEQERERQLRLKHLQRDLSTLVTNTDVAADARVVLQQRERAQAQTNRDLLLDKESTSSQKTYDEILRGQFEILCQPGIPEDLQKAIKNQQQLYDSIVQDKETLINDLQQELKLQGDNYVSTLRRKAEEINVMIARMDDQIKLMTKAYREELAQIERLYRQEISLLLTKDMEGLERDMNKLRDEELERLMERKKKVKEYEKELQKMRDNDYVLSTLENEKSSKRLAGERDEKRNQGINFVLNLRKGQKQKTEEILLESLKKIKTRASRTVKEIANLKKIYTDEEKQFSKQSMVFLEDYKRHIQKYERTKKQIKHFSVADAKRFEEVWLMIEAEVKQLAQRALAVDSVISQQILGLTWKEPDMSILELPGPLRPWKSDPEVSLTDFQTTKRMQGRMDGSAGSEVDTPDMTVRTEGAAASSGTDSEEGKRSKDMEKKMAELLCNETDFLMDAKFLKLLAPLVTEEQTGVKWGSLLYTLGIEEKDLPQLTGLFLKYKQREAKQTEDASELIHPNQVLPALKSFLEQRNSRQSSAQQISRLWLAHGRDSSKDAAYWESLGNIIPEEKVKLWDAAETTLKEYHAVLTDISDLIPENEHLRQQNMELRLELSSRLKN